MLDEDWWIKFLTLLAIIAIFLAIGFAT